MLGLVINIVALLLVDNHVIAFIIYALKFPIIWKDCTLQCTYCTMHIVYIERKLYTVFDNNLILAEAYLNI